MTMGHKILGNSRGEDVGIVKHWPMPSTSPPPSSSTTTKPASSSQDYERWLEELAPHEPVSQYRHNDTGEDNADAHILPLDLVLGQAPGDGPRGGGSDYRGQAGFWPLGADLLRRIRRAPAQAGAD